MKNSITINNKRLSNALDDLEKSIEDKINNLSQENESLKDKIKYLEASNQNNNPQKSETISQIKKDLEQIKHIINTN